MLESLIEGVAGLYGLWSARRNGRRDGRAGLPRSGEESSFESQLRSAYQTQVARVHGKWKETDAGRLAKWRNARGAYVQAGKAVDEAEQVWRSRKEDSRDSAAPPGISRQRGILSFWQGFFVRAKADFDPARWGAALLAFEPEG